MPRCAGAPTSNAAGAAQTAPAATGPLPQSPTADQTRDPVPATDATAAGENGKHEEEADYELAAILIHKGTSAHHGHYVAHVSLPPSDGGGGGGAASSPWPWWRFDDDGVSPLAGGPAGKVGAAPG